MPQDKTTLAKPIIVICSNKNEPALTTHPALLKILGELIAREPIFHRPEHGTTRADFENMTLPDFWEVGASGSRYSRDYVLDTLEERHETHEPEAPWETNDFHCRELAPNVYLLTYTLIQKEKTGNRKTRRTTIWHHTPSGWKIVFHQGTVVQHP